MKLSSTLFLLLFPVVLFGQSIQNMPQTLMDCGLIVSQEKLDQAKTLANSGLLKNVAELVPYCERGRIVPEKRYDTDDENVYFVCRATSSLLPELKGCSFEIGFDESSKQNAYSDSKTAHVTVLLNGKTFGMSMRDWSYGETGKVLYDYEFRELINTFNTILKDLESPNRMHYVDLRKTDNDDLDDHFGVLAMNKETWDNENNPFTNVRWSYLGQYMNWPNYWNTAKKVEVLEQLNALHLIDVGTDSVTLRNLALAQGDVTSGGDLLINSPRKTAIPNSPDELKGYYDHIAALDASSDALSITEVEFIAREFNENSMRQIDASMFINGTNYTFKFEDDGYTFYSNLYQKVNQLLEEESSIDGRFYCISCFQHTEYILWLTTDEHKECTRNGLLRFSHQVIESEIIMEDSGIKN